MSHHGNDAQKIAQNVKVNTYHMRLFAKFLEKLRATPDGDGSVLDHSLIFYGGGMGNPNGHASDPLPVLAVGGGAGKGHRHIKVQAADAGRQPVAGGRATSSAAGSRRFGDSNGRVEDLFCLRSVAMRYAVSHRARRSCCRSPRSAAGAKRTAPVRGHSGGQP